MIKIERVITIIASVITIGNVLVPSIGYVVNPNIPIFVFPVDHIAPLVRFVIVLILEAALGYIFALWIVKTVLLNHSIKFLIIFGLLLISVLISLANTEYFLSDLIPRQDDLLPIFVLVILCPIKMVFIGIEIYKSGSINPFYLLLILVQFLAYILILMVRDMLPLMQ